MGRHALTTIICLLAAPVAARASIPAFFRELAAEFAVEYAPLQERAYTELCARYGIDIDDPANAEVHLQLAFLHDLLTCVSADDCARGGILEIPYFWHWIEPNPRHAIVALPDSTLLADHRPAAPYDRYASRADIDRVPALYLTDLVSEQPRYHHPECETFFTFGWCSEREMAFVALATALGFSAKIVQFGIHTHTEVWVPLRRVDGTTMDFAVRIDNTFDTITWLPLPAGKARPQWLGEEGEGARVHWYNQQARSPRQLEVLRGTAVGPRARERIRTLVRAAIRSAR